MSSDGKLPNPLDNVEPRPYIDKFKVSDSLRVASARSTYSHFKNRPMSKFVDPCEEAAKASYKCLDKFDYDRDKCTDFFQAYRDCKKTWMEQRKADRRAGRAVGS
ncbi:hypothetical protein BC835DRAFT_1262118 [Cytidiella melzeri]|nr:hypothetical protein BC835DRAFT_1262118 [Cytidiella melzeri]